VLTSRFAGLVRSCVRHYRSSPEPAEDLMQVGYVGLLKAINNFDPAFGNGLAAYAEPCVMGELKRHFRDKRWQIRVPRQAQELLLEIHKAAEELTQQLGRAPRDSEVAAWLGVTDADLRRARQAELAFSAYSLDMPLSDDDEPALLGDMIGADDEGAEHVTDIESVYTHLGDLPEREQRILMLRYYGNLTQTEIATRLGISQMHVSRLQTRALRYLHDQLTEPDASGPITAAGLSRPGCTRSARRGRWPATGRTRSGSGRRRARLRCLERLPGRRRR
jgi:RNA polymerase sigma-B factor